MMQEMFRQLLCAHLFADVHASALSVKQAEAMHHSLPPSLRNRQSSLLSIAKVVEKRGVDYGWLSPQQQRDRGG